MKILINIDVPDLKAAIRFYAAALDLRLNRIIDEDVADLDGGSSMIYLLLQPALTEPVVNLDAKRNFSRHWTPVHLDFVVDDLDLAVERAVTAGARQERPVHFWRGSSHVSFSDPFGHGFCLIALEGSTYFSK